MGPGDTAWTSPNTFPATSNAVLFCGAKIDFVDIDSKTYNLCPKALRQKLEIAKQKGCLPKVVIPVHFAGQSCDMAAIANLSKEFGFAVIEDASHAVGADYKRDKVGSCSYSDLCVFSFHPVKIMTTGEGGVVTTNSPELQKKLALLRSHGITRNKSQYVHEDHGPWYYEQVDLAPNYRMTDIQAGLGISQLGKLDSFVSRRRELVKQYNDFFDDIPDVRPYWHPDTAPSWHLYVIQVGEGVSRRWVFETLCNDGIGVNVHYIPVHTHPYYEGLGFKIGDFPRAESYYEQAITLPLYAGLKDEDQAYIAQKVKAALKEARK